MKPILLKRGIGKGASAMDGRGSRDIYYMSLGTKFRSLGKWRLGFMELSHVVRIMEQERWSSQYSRTTLAWVLTPAISLWAVDDGPAEYCRDNEVNDVELVTIFRSMYRVVYLVGEHVSQKFFAYANFLAPKASSLIKVEFWLIILYFCRIKLKTKYNILVELIIQVFSLRKESGDIKFYNSFSILFYIYYNNKI